MDHKTNLTLAQFEELISEAYVENTQDIIGCIEYLSIQNGNDILSAAAYRGNLELIQYVCDNLSVDYKDGFVDEVLYMTIGMNSDSYGSTDEELLEIIKVIAFLFDRISDICDERLLISSGTLINFYSCPSPFKKVGEIARNMMDEALVATACEDKIETFKFLVRRGMRYSLGWRKFCENIVETQSCEEFRFLFDNDGDIKPPTTSPKDFLTIARKLMNNTMLHVNHAKYRIVEIEFYLYSESHPDVCTHRHPDQLEYEKWYFHRASLKPGAKYKGGTFKGLDMTFGNGKDHGGILIRSVIDLSTQQIYEGPCVTVNRILQECKTKTISELVDEINLDTYTEDKLYISSPINNKEFENMPISKGPRIGLTTKKEGSEHYVNRNYRFAAGTFIKKRKRSLEKL